MVNMSEGETSSDNPRESPEMSTYKKEALNVVSFKIVYDEEDLSSGTPTFKPEMAHQIFGEGEFIFGYRHVSIDLHYLHNSSRCYLDIKSIGKIENQNLHADDIPKLLNSWLPENFTTNYEEFLEMLRNEEHDKMFGDVIATFEDTKEVEKFPDHHIKATYKITVNNTENPEFKSFHEKFETIIVWFIDAANFIDLDDVRWRIFYVYEEYVHPISKILYRSPIGFCTVYQFFSFPANIRPRISQFFILPSHQKRGIGTKFYETIAHTLRSQDNVIDLAVEEPTKEFQRIRDLDDCFIMHKVLVKSNISFFDTPSSLIFNMAKQQKIGKRQTQRLYDILGLYYSAEKGSSHYTKYINLIKDRISSNTERQSRASKRFCNLERAGVAIQIERSAIIDTELKRHLDDIEPSVKYLQKKLKDRVRNWLLQEII